MDGHVAKGRIKIWVNAYIGAEGASPMFDPVTDHVLQMRRRGAPAPVPGGEPVSRTSRICSVCKREIRPEEQVFWVGVEAHCFQCHDMLKYEYDKERVVDAEVREKGTRWEDQGDG